MQGESEWCVSKVDKGPDLLASNHSETGENEGRKSYLLLMQEAKLEDQLKLRGEELILIMVVGQIYNAVCKLRLISLLTFYLFSIFFLQENLFYNRRK